MGESNKLCHAAAMVINEHGDQFAGIARSLRSQADEVQTLQRAIDVALDVIDGCDYAAIALVRNRNRIETPAATDDIARRGNQLQHELDEGPCLDIQRGENVVSSPDLLAEHRWSRWAPRVVDELGVRSLLCFELFTTNESLGALSLYSHRPDAFDTLDHATGLAFAAHIAVALASRRDIDGHNRAMVNRIVIGQAEGILMERYGLTADQAFTFLKRVSQDSNSKLAEVAIELVRSRLTPGAKTAGANPAGAKSA